MTTRMVKKLELAISRGLTSKPQHDIVKLTCCKEDRTYLPKSDTILHVHDLLPNLKGLSA